MKGLFATGVPGRTLLVPKQDRAQSRWTASFLLAEFSCSGVSQVPRPAEAESPGQEPGPVLSDKCTGASQGPASLENIGPFIPASGWQRRAGSWGCPHRCGVVRVAFFSCVAPIVCPKQIMNLEQQAYFERTRKRARLLKKNKRKEN